MKITYLGHSSFLVETSKARLVFDPFISGNPLASDQIQLADLKPDYILVSHGHGDHVGDLMELAKMSGATVISSFEVETWVRKQGHDKAHGMNFSGSWEFDFGKVKMFQAAHTSSFPDGSYAGAAGGFIIEADGKCFYYAGDTGLFLDLKLIPMLHQLDFAFLPIGDNFTMDAKQAAMAMEFIDCKTCIGMHYDTFGFIKIDHEKAREHFAKRNKKLILQRIGEQIEL